MASKGEVSIGDEAAEPTAVVASRPRAGGLALSVLGTPLNLLVLRALSDGPMRLAELRKATGLPAQTTLRGHLARLGEIGMISKRPARQMPYAVESELTPLGRELLEVAEQLEAWLGGAPDGPIALESGAAKGIVKALVDGWGSAMIGALATRPLSLTELDGLISDLTYPALERRLSSMRIAGLVEPQPSPGVGTPYAVTDWARRGIAPLIAASHCEQLYLRNETAPLTQGDIEAAFLLATPLVGLPATATGSCQLAVEENGAQVRRPAGVRVTVEGGKVVSCVSKLEPSPGTYAVGTGTSWFHVFKEGRIDQLQFGGGRRFAENMVTGLHVALNDLC